MTVVGRKTGGKTIDSVDLLQEYQEKELRRRSLLLGALGLGASAALAGCGDNGNTGGGGGGGTSDAGSDAGVAQDVPPMRTQHLVGAGQNDDHIMAAEAALAETAGFSNIQRGQRVYIKVNTNSGDPFPYSTSPELLRWVIGKVRDAGAEVFVGDRSFFGDRNTLSNFTRNGIREACEMTETPLFVFGDRAANDAASNVVDWMDLPATVEGMARPRSAFWDGTMRIPAMVAQADHIINMAVVKTHFIATFTMTMKNIIGIINPVDRSRTSNLGSHDGRVGGRLYPQVAYMNKALPTSTLNILDGFQALISGGPTPGDRPSGIPAGWMPQTAEPKVVIVSADRLAADLTGAALLRTLSPSYEQITRGDSLWTNRQLQVAIEAGVGITDRAQYDLSGPTVTEIARLREIATA